MASAIRVFLKLGDGRLYPRREVLHPSVKPVAIFRTHGARQHSQWRVQSVDGANCLEQCTEKMGLPFFWGHAASDLPLPGGEYAETAPIPQIRASRRACGRWMELNQSLAGYRIQCVVRRVAMGIHVHPHHGLRIDNVMSFEWDWRHNDKVDLPKEVAKTKDEHGIPLNKTGLAVLDEVSDTIRKRLGCWE
jgi:hypothetical protein